MLKEILFDQTSDVLLKKMLDRAAVAQRVISSNIANIGTPGYQRLGVFFDERLRDALRNDVVKMKTTDPRHMPEMDALKTVKPKVTTSDSGYWNGINNVNIDQEMVDIAKNQLDYNAAVKIKSIRSSELRMAIKGKI